LTARNPGSAAIGWTARLTVASLDRRLRGILVQTACLFSASTDPVLPYHLVLHGLEQPLKAG
jgi:hypothetical protein